MNFVSAKLPDDQLAFSNKIFVSRTDFASLHAACKKLQSPVLGTDDSNLVSVNDSPFILTVAPHKKVAAGTVAFSGPLRRLCAIALSKPVLLAAWSPPSQVEAGIILSHVVVEVDFLAKKAGKQGEVSSDDVYAEIVGRYLDGQHLRIGQVVVGDVFGQRLELKVVKCEAMGLDALALSAAADHEVSSTANPKHGSAASGSGAVPADGGILTLRTNCSFVLASNSTLTLTGAGGAGSGGGTAILDQNWNFENMGIGGLRNEFNQIFRRAFASRVFPPAMIAKLGISHVKGILLFGPPGTGKTLMARQIGQMLNGKDPKVVNGPEILNKFVGQSEENIRELFKDAEEEYLAKGENSSLHIIIFDEIDAICRQRGSRSDGTGVHDGVVNQLLSKIDGVNSLNNILVIGMTNRKDLLDDALLRAGRLEVHIEINLPDTDGRLQILNIHTRAMREHDMLGADVDLRDLAKRTKNFSGAELEALVKAATSFALYRNVDTTDGISVKEAEAVVIGRDAFEHALTEIKPAFGISEAEFETAMRNGIVHFSPAVDALLQTGDVFIRQVATSERTPLITMLLEGPPGAGKTALAAKLAKSSGYPFVKLITPETLVTYGEMGKADKITKTFLDAYKSPLSCIVIDDLERLLDYVRVGPRFSNIVLQTLLVLLRREPPPGHSLFVIATTSNARVLHDLEFAECFNARLQVPFVTNADECRAVLRDLNLFSMVSGSKSEGDDSSLLEGAANAFTSALSESKHTQGVPVKRLIMAAEMCMQGDEPFSVSRFEHAMRAIMGTFGAGNSAGADDFGEIM